MFKRFTDEDKARILARVAEIGAAAAAREAGVSYNSVLRWVHEGPANAVKKGVEMTGDLDLKALLKAKAKAEKEKEQFEAAEQKKQLVEAVMNSGKSVDEIIAFLNK